MKNRLSVFVVLFCMVSSLCLAGAVGEKKQNSDVDTKIQLFVDYLLEGKHPDEDCKKGFYFLLEAIVLSLPQAGYPEKFNNQITKANSLFKKNGIFDANGVQLLRKAYCSINDGKDFKIPDDISTIDQAKEYGNNMIEMSRKHLKEGKVDIAVKLLLETAVMVVTPFIKGG
ncbi:MAG: hypothetical protein JSV88_33495 [Candidatus Aminicenantes bacterium]|nr:MAG: hypothetical protein JSV88_33495 [Candidatus Aminicenantes bacterium]